MDITYRIMRQAEELKDFVTSKLNNDESNPFFQCRERYLLQAVIGIIGESDEFEKAYKDALPEKLDDLLTELGDVFFYLSVLFIASEKYEPFPYSSIIPDKKFDTVIECLEATKKIVFQGRIELLPSVRTELIRRVASLVVVAGALSKLDNDVIEESVKAMKNKLNKRYENGFSVKESRERNE